MRISGTLWCYTRNPDGSWQEHDKTGGGAWGRSNSNLKVGWSVAQDGAYQAAGAPAEASNRGAVYVRQKTGSYYQARGFVVEADTSIGNLFGSAVALDWPYLAVGAPGYGSNGAGFLYEFSDDGGNWKKVGNRVDPAGLGLSIVSLGKSVAVSDGMVLIGGAGSAVLHVRTSLLSTTPAPTTSSTPLPLPATTLTAAVICVCL